MTTYAPHWPVTAPNVNTMTIAAVMEHATDDELCGSERAILAAIAQLTNREGICRATHRELKKASQVHTNQFSALIRILRRKSWLSLGPETATYIPTIPLHIAARAQQ